MKHQENGEEREGHHRELECRRAARQTSLTKRNWNVNGLLEKVQDCWHFHQLFRQLRLANRCSRRDVLEDVLGTLKTCSATTTSASTNWSTSIHQVSPHQRRRRIERQEQQKRVEGLEDVWSTICSTGASRSKTSSFPMPACRSMPCGLCSSKEASRVPAVGLPSSDENSKYSAGPTPVLVPIFCPRRAAFAVSTLGYEWWFTVASTAVIDCCSCRHHERSSSTVRQVTTS